MHRFSIVLRLTALTALMACKRPATPPLASNSCRIEAARALSTEPGERPIGLLEQHGGAFVLSVTPGGDNHVSARLRRVNGERVETVATAATVREAAVSNLTSTPDGPVFAIATAHAVVARVATASGIREVNFPRGEPPAGRESIVPALALTRAPDGTLEALANFGPRFGLHRIHTGDVGESIGYTPMRQDIFAAPALTIAGDLAVLVQQRRIGTFTTRGSTLTQLESIGLPADPLVAQLATPDAIGSEPVTEVLASRAAAIAAPGDGPIARIAYRAGNGVYRVDVTRRTPLAGAPLIGTSAPISVSPGTAVASSARTAAEYGSSPGAPAVIDMPGPCGSLIAWVSPGAQDRNVDIARVDRSTATMTAVEARRDTLIHIDAGQDSPRLEFAAAGNRAILAIEAAGKVSATEVTLGPACQVRLRPIAIPAAMRTARLLGVASEAQRAVLATAVRDGDGSRVSFVTFDASGALSTQPAPRRVESDARMLGLLGEGAIVIAGVSPRGIHIDRLAGTAAGDEDETLVIRGSRGEDFVMVASAAHRRVWVAEALDTGNLLFGPAQTVVLHSFIGTLEDGPRTEVHTGSVPSADFARFTVDTVMLPDAAGGGSAPAWATTFSQGESGDGHCLAGAYVALFGSRDDQLIGPRARPADAAWPGAIGLSAPGSSTCLDRIGNVVWNGPRFVLTLTTPAAGTQLVRGDATTGTWNAVPLEGIPRDASPSGLTTAGAGFAVAWTEPRGDRSVSLQARLFRADGRADGPVIALAGVDTSAGRDAVPTPLASLGGREFSVAHPTAQGPRLSRIVCGAAP